MPRTARPGSTARAVPSTRSAAAAKSPAKLGNSKLAKATKPAKANGAKPNGKRPAKAPAPAPAPTPEPTVIARPSTLVPPAPPVPMGRPLVPSTPPPAPTPAVTRPSHRPGPPPGIAIPPLPLVPAPDFKVGDKAVHPSHGVGEVTAIEKREIGGSSQNFYILKILDNAMKVMVPTSAATQVGLRAIMSDKEANNILSTMRAREVAVDVQPWSRRFRVYTEMIKSGSPVEIAKVLRDMNRLKFDKDLSFGERRLLDQARSLLLKELAFAKKKTEAEMAEEIKKIFTA
jgi:CarD family transcriptional regulator